MVTTLVLPVRAMAWELRVAWATGRRVAVSLERGSRRRVEGHVGAVSATGAWVKVAGLLVPLDDVLAVHYPSRLGDSSVRGGPWQGRRRLRDECPGQLQFAV